MMPTLGVLITYYNEQQLLTECLESLLSQETRVTEILVYDDASCFPAIDYLPLSSDVLINVIRSEENRGPAFGRNALLKHTQCDYVHFHDTDDFFAPKWCSQIRQVLEQQEVDAIFTEIAAYKDGQLECEKVLNLSALNVDSDLVRFCINGAILPASGSYRRNNLLEVGGYCEGLWQSEDWEFHVRLAASGLQYVVIDEPLVGIRLRNKSRSQNRIEVWRDAVRAVSSLAQELPLQYRNDLANAAVRFGAALFQLGDKEQARVAFKLAWEIGPPSLDRQKKLYRILAKTLGFEWAEYASSLYRRMLPEKFRQFMGARV
jgi:glycosyltransferase involved in cell wall biosynthesis